MPGTVAGHSAVYVQKIVKKCSIYPYGMREGSIRIVVPHVDHHHDGLLMVMMMVMLMTQGYQRSPEDLADRGLSK